MKIPDAFKIPHLPEPSEQFTALNEDQFKDKTDTPTTSETEYDPNEDIHKVRFHKERNSE